MNQGPVNSRAITVVGMTIVGLVGALFLGRAVASGDFKLLLIAFAALTAMAIGLALGRNYWILIPATFFATGSIGALPLPFSYQEIGIIGAFGLYLIHVAFKKQNAADPWNAVDVFLWTNMAYLVSVYIRNPVGTFALRSELVGGRPFFTLLLMTFAFLVLSQARVSPKVAKIMPLLLAAAMIAPSFLNMITEFYPGAARFIYPFYSGVSIEAFNLNPGGPGGSEETRIFSFADIGRPLVLVLCAFFPPITLINPMYMGRFVLMTIALVMSGLSGFRNLLIGNAAAMVIGSAVRRRYLDILILAIIGTSVTVLLSSLYMAGAPVPIPIQRALSFIPLDWDYNAKKAAQDTADWRIEMWKEAWVRPDIMRNKLLGDGFGYTMKEMMIMSDTLLGIGHFMGSSNYEMFLIKGAFHSGPLSTIKRVGFVGGILLLCWMIMACRYSLLMLRKTRTTPFFAWTLFIAIPIIYLPFEYILIFGDYTNAVTSLLFSAGMFKMINNSLREAKASMSAEDILPEPIDSNSSMRHLAESEKR